MRVASIPVARIEWRPSYRIIPSRFPTVNLFERVADAADLEAVFTVEALTNDRLRAETGKLALLPPEERIAGPGASFIMSAFTRLNPLGSRFSDGTFGVYYCAHEEETAIAETAYHRATFLSYTMEPPCEIDMRVLLANLHADLHDLRVGGRGTGALLDPHSYAAGRELGRKLKAENSSGIAYPSVRRQGGECAAVFRPRALSACKQGKHLCYVWDGQRIIQVYEKRIIH